MVGGFDVDGFLGEIAGCATEPDPRHAAKEALARALAAPGAVADAIGPATGGITLLHHTPGLTAINVAWAPGMRLMPHDHRMWALIGIYAGVEDNEFYRRTGAGGIEPTTGRRVTAGEICSLGRDAVHAVANPTARLTAAIHVYGGDFVHQPRSQWGPGDLVERPFDMTDVEHQFREANRAAGLRDGDPPNEA